MRSLIPLFLFMLITSCKPEEKETNKESPKEQEKEILVKADGKKPMILLADRPANLETPLRYFLLDITPNDVFFVRWHSSNMPSQVDSNTFRLKVGGHVNRQLSLSVQDLRKKFKQYKVTALAQCAGNSRSFCDPRVPGGQWKNGAMGNAEWTGVKLKDILSMAGVRTGAFDVAFNGMDEPPLDSTPDFVKSLRATHCIDGEVIVAYEMNGKPLPLLNGYPLKLIVPGWYATYWIGMLHEIKVYPDTFHGYWMQKAYLVPKDISNGNEKPDTLAKNVVPIGKMDVRSIFVAPEPKDTLMLGTSTEVQGLAMDGGDGIANVEISLDNCKTWQPAKLDRELGKYSWRRWRYTFTPNKKGNCKLWVKATNTKGETQPPHQWNRSGYMRNEVESITYVVQ
ncbi:MAG: cytochrome C biosynthesis protein [Flavobacteriaceae bacterium]|nr:cytochrome C biosynthesis protein [Flavobacteriaceae bacterium]